MFCIIYYIVFNVTHVYCNRPNGVLQYTADSIFNRLYNVL